MAYKILITDDISEKSLDTLNNADDIEYDILKGLTQEKLVQHITIYDGLIVRSSVKVNEDVLKFGDKLKTIKKKSVLSLQNMDIKFVIMIVVIILNMYSSWFL